MARRGRPTVEITNHPVARGAGDARALGAPPQVVAGAGVALPDRLGCADGLTHAEIARQMWRTPVTVGKRHRFAVDRLDGLTDAPRPGAQRTINDEVVEAVVVDTLESAPADATHRSTRGLASGHGISHITVGGMWRAFGLKPWSQHSFKVSPDPELLEKIRYLVALRPPRRVSPLQALTRSNDRWGPSVPAGP